MTKLKEKKWKSVRGKYFPMFAVFTEPLFAGAEDKGDQAGYLGKFGPVRIDFTEIPEEDFAGH